MNKITLPIAIIIWSFIFWLFYYNVQISNIEFKEKEMNLKIHWISATDKELIDFNNQFNKEMSIEDREEIIKKLKIR